jgi:hypothetical protein
VTLNTQTACRVDGVNSYMYCPEGGSGATLNEHFLVYTPGMLPMVDILVDDPFIVRSKFTGRWVGPSRAACSCRGVCCSWAPGRPRLGARAAG